MPKYFVYTSGPYSHRVTSAATGNVYGMYKGRSYLVKDEKDIAWFESNPRFEEVDEASVPVQNPAKSASDLKEDPGKKYTREELDALDRKGLLEILTNLNAGRIPRLNQHKIDKILELQGGEDMAEEEQSPETTETPEKPAEDAEKAEESSESSEESE